MEVKDNQDMNECDVDQEINDISSFKHRAIPLDELEILDSDGNQNSIKKLM